MSYAVGCGGVEGGYLPPRRDGHTGEITDTGLADEPFAPDPCKVASITVETERVVACRVPEEVEVLVMPDFSKPLRGGERVPLGAIQRGARGI